jgi:hypothetical protein
MPTIRTTVPTPATAKPMKPIGIPPSSWPQTSLKAVSSWRSWGSSERNRRIIHRNAPAPTT